MQEYIHRVGRTARGAHGKGHALLFLLPEEVAFLRYLKHAKVCVVVDIAWRVPVLYVLLNLCTRKVNYPSKYNLVWPGLTWELGGEGQHTNSTCHLCSLISLICQSVSIQWWRLYLYWTHNEKFNKPNSPLRMLHDIFLKKFLPNVYFFVGIHWLYTFFSLPL